ncbi:Grx4 family monothiol glutaredoxin [Sideroxydans sp. CL21]|jgi:monothiol glutaredoxin|uniref:Grx4 family monothiol glutaredoxin n=1 Tax=Sideroxydans sp. CL21 TaxID=2600596 RepID=UPI0012A9C975|nr:Grx4 family monothiol glutaredoxin [Sideroxydans sp. CL21]VVC83246.1 Glutaredoxin-related protein [Sideroxydans sp. CL21]
MDEKTIALEKIRKTVTENPIVLYMKGTPQFPQCGFSGRAAQVLKACGVDRYVAVNVLADQEVFDNLRFYADFPTFPQLYINGELIGGSDIMVGLYEQGELQKLIETATAH